MYQAPIVKKAFQILSLIAGEEKQRTISDLARELGISKSTVHGITRALEEVGALIRERIRNDILSVRIFSNLPEQVMPGLT